MSCDFVIGAGGNLGERVRLLCSGLTQLAHDPDVTLVALSSVLETEPVGPPQPPYLNAAVAVRCGLSPEALLDRLLAIEAAHGRVRAHKLGPRTLDLDLLWCGSPRRTARVTVPHPRLAERGFALRPLLEVAPELAPRYAAAFSALTDRPTRVGQLRLEGGRVRCVPLSGASV